MSTFINSEEKIRDLFRYNKHDFLDIYNDVTNEDYECTLNISTRADPILYTGDIIVIKGKTQRYLLGFVVDIPEKDVVVQVFDNVSGTFYAIDLQNVNHIDVVGIVLYNHRADHDLGSIVDQVAFGKYSDKCFWL